MDWGWWVAGPEASHPYLVLEWVRGMSLYEWARVHPVTQRRVLQVAEQVAGALAVMHLGDVETYRKGHIRLSCRAKPF